MRVRASITLVAIGLPKVQLSKTIFWYVTTCMDLQEVGGMDWIELAQDRDR